MHPFRLIPAVGLLLSSVALAQTPKPSDMPPAVAAARRFPQPVRVGDLHDRAVLQPLESKPVLGRVAGVVQRADGTVDVVVQYGGLFGFGRRPIAVPLDAMALLGAEMEILDLTPKQLDALPTFDAAGTTPLPLDSTIKVALARPSH